MTRLSVILATLMATNAALAVEPGRSNDETVIFKTDERLFKGVDESLGFDYEDTWLGQDIKIGGSVNADTSCDLELVMEGTSTLSWPDILANKWKDNGDGDGGLITLKNKAATWLEVSGEAFGIAVGYELWREEVDWRGEYRITSLLLEGTPGGKTATLAAKGDSLIEFEEDWSPNPTGDYPIEFTLRGSVAPKLNAVVTGKNIEIEDEVVTSTSAVAILDAPTKNNGEVMLEAKWNGQVDADVGLEFVPELEVSWRGFNVKIPYPVYVDIFDDVVDFDTDWTEVVHDLPAAVPSVSTLDFGQVQYGEKGSTEFSIENIGNVDLTGKIRVEGDAAFVIADSVVLVPRDNDGPAKSQTFKVDFLPTEEASYAGEIILETSDPVNPEIRIPLAGVGVKEVVDPDGEGGNVTGLARGCSCSTSAPAGAGFAGLLALGLIGLVGRRRR